jgi:hypothetical protein
MKQFMLINQKVSTKIKPRFCECIETLYLIFWESTLAKLLLKHCPVFKLLKPATSNSDGVNGIFPCPLPLTVYLLFVGFFCPQKVEEQI